MKIKVEPFNDSDEITIEIKLSFIYEKSVFYTGEFKYYPKLFEKMYHSSIRPKKSLVTKSYHDTSY